MVARRVTWVVVLAGLLLPAAARAETPITTLAGQTAVRVWTGTAVLSVRDASTGRYTLSVQRGTGRPTAIPGLAPASRPFDADIGPGPGGTATIVDVRCRAGGRCHLYRTTPRGGGESLIAGAASTGGSESAPTVWGSRLAFARSYGRGSARVYTRPLAAPASVPSIRVPGVPLRICEDSLPCRSITDGRVPELELRRTTLAEIVRFGLKGAGICGAGQIRLIDVRTRRDDKVDDTVCGLSGSTYLGLSLTASRLLYARVCPVDPGGCRGRSALVYRYAPRSRRMEAATRPALLSGFAAIDDGHALEVRRQPSRSQPSTPAQLVLTGPLDFTPERP